MDGSKQTMTLSGVLYMTWVDGRIKWDSSTYGGATFTRVPATTVWTPTLDVFNAADVPTTIAVDPDTDQVIQQTCHKYKHHSINSLLQVSIYSSGMIVFTRKIQLVTSCTFDVRKFPVDTQTCSIELAIMGYTTQVKN